MYDGSQHSRDSLLHGAIPRATPDVVSKAELIITMPDLSLKVVDMHDDGLHSDGLADVSRNMYGVTSSLVSWLSQSGSLPS